MRYLGLLSLAVAGLSFAGGCFADQKAAERPPVEMTLTRVGAHTYYVPGGAGAATDNHGFISNAGVIVTGEGVVVLDALGTPALARMLVERIREVTDKPIRTVVVTHYHADHIYGLQVFKDLGARIIAPVGAQRYIGSEQAANRLAERRASLWPWVDEDTRVVPADHYVKGAEDFELGGVRFSLIPFGAAHSEGDLAMLVQPDAVLYSGDIIFEGRVPFVGDADSKQWLQALGTLDTQGLKGLVPGHGPAAKDPVQAVELTRRYLAFLRERMGAAVEELQSFAEAYAQTDWSEFAHLPAFEAANRSNAYGVYLGIEAEMLGN